MKENHLQNKFSEEAAKISFNPFLDRLPSTKQRYNQKKQLSNFNNQGYSFLPTNRNSEVESTFHATPPISQAKQSSEYHNDNEELNTRPEIIKSLQESQGLANMKSYVENLFDSFMKNLSSVNLDSNTIFSLNAQIAKFIILDFMVKFNNKSFESVVDDFSGEFYHQCFMSSKSTIDMEKQFKVNSFQIGILKLGQFISEFIVDHTFHSEIYQEDNMLVYTIRLAKSFNYKPVPFSIFNVITLTFTVDYSRLNIKFQSPSQFSFEGQKENQDLLHEIEEAKFKIPDYYALKLIVWAV